MDELDAKFIEISELRASEQKADELVFRLATVPNP